MRWDEISTLVQQSQASRSKPQWLTMENARTFQFHCDLPNDMAFERQLWIRLLKIYLCVKTWWKQNDGKRISLKMFENEIFHIFTGTQRWRAFVYTKTDLRMMLQIELANLDRVCVRFGCVTEDKSQQTSKYQMHTNTTARNKQHFATWCEWLYKTSEWARWISLAPRWTHSFAIQRFTGKPTTTVFNYRFEFAWCLFELYFSQFY